ncbi:hypothetical protein [Roseococcus sp. YIM B11640]|uniref:hypothetical protein n=1 Tax=Roseococcus sp. YIM B11640 TaxID=3133973 RepID=UPI003C7981B0
MLKPIAAALLALAATQVSPAPAWAATPQFCVTNSSATIIRSRFSYLSAGQRYQSGWVTSAAGQQNCVRLQDVSEMEFQVDVNDFTWKSICRSKAPRPLESAVLNVTGTAFGVQCNLLQ